MTIAIGIVAFAMVAVVGLLPVGLNSQKQSAEQARGIQALNDATEALRGIRKEGTSYKFLPPLTNLIVGPGAEQFFLLGNGTLAGSTAPDARAKVFINQLAPVNSLQPVFVSVAWPSTATRSGNSWSNAQGSVGTFLYFRLPR